MWTLKKPLHSANEAFATCISRIRDAGLKQRMESIADDITEAAEAYHDAAGETELHLIQTADNVGGEVSGEEMVKLYTGRMVPKASAGRPIYDAIMALPDHGRCPFCGHRVVTTLDHLLSKAQHPALVVTPNNLVPSCSDCNKAKLDDQPAADTDQFLHPYFDEIEDDLWLTAEVLETIPASVRFDVEPHENWPAVTAARVQNHFRRLGLATLYGSQAAEELVNIRYQVGLLFERAGADGVREFLHETWESRSQARVNSWQTAFYRALSESDWYCEGGFSEH